jgi:thiol-disulfide isomerase/thioredoxin
MYTGDRSLADLSRWIDEQSTLYARGQLVTGDRHEEEIVLSGFGRPNPDGKVLEVDEAGLDVVVGNGPVLVEFFAPWCGQ